MLDSIQGGHDPEIGSLPVRAPRQISTSPAGFACLGQQCIDPNLSANLRQLLLWHKRSAELANEPRAEVVDNFQAALLKGEPALEAMYQIGEIEVVHGTDGM